LTSTPISILDLAAVDPDRPVRDSLDTIVDFARRAEELGYRRVWYAEHHNFDTIASSAPAVLIAHVAAHTTHIRLGAGGVMLPNHAPLVIAEQFGTLETLHPGRIDLGLGRAPGTDQTTLRALRRTPGAADTFPQDVLELEGYLTGATRIPGVNAMPGRGTNVPLYILGSSLFGAQLAAQLGLPYAFASHFAPQALHEAVATYRREFRPSSQLGEPYVMAGINVVAADTDEAAREQLQLATRLRTRALLGRGRDLTDDEVDQILRSPEGAHLNQMLTYTAVGTPDVVRTAVDHFAEHSGADELIVVFPGVDVAARLRSLELLAAAVGLVP
jgi:luciferase family oxidoreductase group 1